PLDGGYADEQLGSELLVGQPFGEPLEEIHFAPGETIRELLCHVRGLSIHDAQDPELGAREEDLSRPAEVPLGDGGPPEQEGHARDVQLLAGERDPGLLATRAGIGEGEVPLGQIGPAELPYGERAEVDRRPANGEGW